MKTFRATLFIILIAFTSNVTAQVVYTTKTGERYHKENCRYLKYSKKEIDIKKAKSLGYTACKVCKPKSKNTQLKTNTSSVLSSKPKPNTSANKTTSARCTGKTQKGSRCKRMTKNSNGRCYQHQ